MKYNIHCMKWFDFSDPQFLTFFVVILASLILLIFVITTFIIVSDRVRKYKNLILDECYTVRVYSIDVKLNKVLYFDRSNINNKMTMEMDEFYKKFHPNDLEKVKSWIFSICVDSKNAEQYIEADVLVHHRKVPAFSLLKLIKYDPKVGVIHFESHLLRYITPAHAIIKKKPKGIIQGVVKRSTIENHISKAKSLKGFTFAIRFVYIKQKALTNDKVERFMIMTLKNEIYPFLHETKSIRQIVELSNNELCLFDLKIAYKDEALRLANSISNALKKCISIKGFSDSIDFSIGVVENAMFFQDCTSIIEHAQEAAIFAYQNKQSVSLYQKHFRDREEIISYRQKISDLIHAKAFRFLFRPIINTANGQVYGYFQYTRAYNTPFTSFIELSKFAEKTGENKTLLSYVSKHVFPKFVSETNHSRNRLFFHISARDINNLLEIFPQIPSLNEVRVIVMLDEQEISDISYNLSEIKNILSEIKSQGFELALSLRDRDLLLDPSVYYEFDYFIAGATMIGEIRRNNRVRLSIHNLIEQLLKYKKPIIATDLEGWQPIELIIKSGISLVSSETILSSNDMILPLDKRKIEKLKTMDKNFS